MRITTNLERVLFRASLRVSEVDTNRGMTHLEGRAAPYGAWTTRGFFQESFASGAFDRSIKEATSPLPLLLFHNAEFWPIGSAESWDSQPDGLHGVWRLDGSAEAERAAQLARDGHLTGLSVGYVPLRSTWETTSDAEWDPSDVSTLDKVTREEARLVETSMVSTPAFAEAQVTLVRSREHTSRVRADSARPRVAEARAWLASM